MASDTLLELLSQAATARLVAAIMQDADEATIKLALAEFPAIVGEILEEAVGRMPRKEPAS